MTTQPFQFHSCFPDFVFPHQLWFCMSSVAWADRCATVYVSFQFFLGAVYDERQSNDKHMSEPKGDEENTIFV